MTFLNKFSFEKMLGIWYNMVKTFNGFHVEKFYLNGFANINMYNFIESSDDENL